MSSTATVKPNDFNAENIEFTEPRSRKGKDGADRLNAFVRYDGKPLWLETPWLNAPFGVNSFPKGDSGNVDWSVNLSARSNSLDTDETIGNFFTQLRAMETRLLAFGVEHSKVIFGEDHPEGVVKVLFNRFIKQDKAEKYPMRIAPKIPRSRGTDADAIRPYVDFFRGSPEPVALESFEQLAQMVPGGSCVRALISPRIYFVSGKFGVAWDVISMKAQTNTSSRPSGLGAFSDESPEAYMERMKKEAEAKSDDAGADADVDAVTDGVAKMSVKDSADDASGEADGSGSGSGDDDANSSEEDSEEDDEEDA